eukprot:520370-Hanusia_phi.AAC.1
MALALSACHSFSFSPLGHITPKNWQTCLVSAGKTKQTTDCFVKASQRQTKEPKHTIMNAKSYAKNNNKYDMQDYLSSSSSEYREDGFDAPDVEDEFYRSVCKREGWKERGGGGVEILVDMQTAQQAWSRAGKIAVQNKRMKIERENSRGNPKKYEVFSSDEFSFWLLSPVNKDVNVAMQYTLIAVINTTQKDFGAKAEGETESSGGKAQGRGSRGKTGKEWRRFGGRRNKKEGIEEEAARRALSSDNDKVKILLRERMKLMQDITVEDLENRVKHRILGKQ